MGGMISFQIELFTDRPELLPETAERARDLRPAFAVIEREWARDNQDKFEASRGMEAVGVEVDPEVLWTALTPGYMKAKRRAGFDDHIMVRTGELMGALTDPERFFHLEDPLEAMFGTPMDPEVLARAGYNWPRRQTIFLSVDDQRMIDKKIDDYLSMGPDFESILFSRGLAAAARRQESAQMDIDFGDSVEK